MKGGEQARDIQRVDGAVPEEGGPPRLSIELSDEDVERMYQEYLKREEKK